MIAADGSAQGNHGALQEEPAAWSAGVYGSAASFPTNDHLIRISHSPTLDLPNALTLAAWIRPESQATQYIVKKARHKYVDGFELSLSYSSGKVFARFNQASEGNAYKVLSQSSYPIDGATWMHVAVTFDGLDIRLYIDGVLETLQPAPDLVIASNTIDLAFGAQDNGRSPFRGGIDDVQLFDTALSAAEIANAMNGVALGPRTCNYGT